MTFAGEHENLLEQLHTRRSILARSAGLALAAPFAAGLLAACGSADAALEAEAGVTWKATPTSGPPSPPPDSGNVTPEQAARIERITENLYPINLLPALLPPPATLAERMTFYATPGVSVTLINEGQLDWSYAWGYQNAEAGEATTTDTLFLAGSISKPISMLGMLRLVERGIVELDTDVNTYLTSWQMPPTGDWQPRLTLRQLASHSAGTTVDGFEGYKRDQPLPTLVQVLNGVPPANSPPVRVDTMPGTQVRYSGGGTTIVQLVIEDVTGQSFADYMQAEVLDPLGMTSSSFHHSYPEEHVERAAVGYYQDGAPVAGGWNVYPELAAAGLWTTATDLARVAVAVQQMLAGTTDGILQPETMRAALTEQIPGGADGLGFFLTGPNHDHFFHGGADEGYQSYLTAYKEVGYGAAIMTNSDQGLNLALELLTAIATEYEWPDFYIYPPRPSPVTPTPESYSEFVGSYALYPDVQIEVTHSGDTLSLAVGPEPSVQLVQVGERQFQVGPLAAWVEFVPSDGDASAALLFTQNGAQLRAELVD